MQFLQFYTLKETLKINAYLSSVIIKKRVFANAYKSFLKILKMRLKIGVIFLKLPSGIKLTTFSYYLFLLPEPTKNIINLDLNKKASFCYLKNKRPKTRGVSKNCVDHPNGGKGRCGLLKKKSPWGRYPYKTY